MCVIMMFEDDYPKKEMLDSAEAMNKDGGGFAWIDKSKGTVRWEKGMHVTAQFIMESIERENIQLPIIVHFRIATHGGVNNELCHPFALSAESGEDLDASGSDMNGVLFHNGIWSDWNSVAMKVLLNNKETRLPEGGFSDSRIMAWLCRHLGTNYLSLIDEKVSVMTPQGIKRFGKGWSTEEKVDCSNLNWKHSRGNLGWGLNAGKSKKDSSPNITMFLGKEDEQDFRENVLPLKGRTYRNDKESNSRENGSVKEGEETALVFQGDREDYESIFRDTVEDDTYTYADHLAELSGKPLSSDVGTGCFDSKGQWHDFDEEFLGDFYDD